MPKAWLSSKGCDGAVFEGYNDITGVGTIKLWCYWFTVLV